MKKTTILLLLSILNINFLVAQNIFINEIHYDNDGADVDEGVEVAGPAGTDLTNWKLYFYNGTDGKNYMIKTLSGTIPNFQNGFGAIFFPKSGIQNGPDAIALVNENLVPPESVIQFISYEGFFQATDGPANGLVSTEINVVEPGALGESLQLQGTGQTYADFIWFTPATNTYDAINTNQTFTPNPEPNMVLSPQSLNPFIIPIGQISENQQYILQGENIVETITITPPSPFEISLNNPDNFSAEPIFIENNLNDPYTIFVRYKPDAEGPHQSSITHATGNSTVSIDVSGITPTITLNPETLNEFSSEINTPSNYQNYDIKGNNLESTISVYLGQNSPFEISLDNPDNFSNDTINIENNLNNPYTIYVRYTPGDENPYEDTLYHQSGTITKKIPLHGATIIQDLLITISEARTKTNQEVTVIGKLTVVNELNNTAYIQDATAGLAIIDPTITSGNFSIGDSLLITATILQEKNNNAENYKQIYASNIIVNESYAGTSPITPKVVAWNQLNNHRGELVTIENVSFPNPGTPIWAESPFYATGNETDIMYVYQSVTGLIGKLQPNACDITGVVGYKDGTRLLPRMANDIPCAENYYTQENVSNYKDQTFDIVTWNIAYFGNGNAEKDQKQKEAVKKVIETLDADIYAFQEIVDLNLFEQLIQELGTNVYGKAVSSYASQTPGVKQKITFLYNKTTVDTLYTQGLLEKIHPLYGNDPELWLTDYINYNGIDSTNLWASGRLPYLLAARIKLGESTEDVYITNIHAKANTSPNPQVDVDRRKKDLAILKDSLDNYFANKALILLGDFNDDVDQTVANVEDTQSTYAVFTEDGNNYKVVTTSLSTANFQSYASFPPYAGNMIDHIMISNKLFENYIPASSRVHYELYKPDFSADASDHIPVHASFEFTPIIPQDFIAKTQNEGIQLVWKDLSHIETAYELQYSLDQESWVTLTLSAGTETFLHKNVSANTTYYYRLRAKKDNKHSSWAFSQAKTGLITDVPHLENNHSFTLSPYPNPTSDVIHFPYTLSHGDQLHLSIFNLQGEKMKDWTITQKNKEGTVTWHIDHTIPGLYIYVYEKVDVNGSRAIKAGKFKVN